MGEATIKIFVYDGEVAMVKLYNDENECIEIYEGADGFDRAFSDACEWGFEVNTVKTVDAWEV